MVVHIAHRGASRRAPENTLEAFRIISAKAGGVEFDLHLSKDNQAVVIHNPTTKDGQSVSALTAAQLEQRGVPLLSDALDLFPPHFRVMAEIKETDSGRVASILSQVNRSISFAAFSPPVLEQIAGAKATSAVIANIDSAAGLTLMMASPYPVLSIHDPLVTCDVIAKAHDLGKEVWVWTVNDLKREEELISWSVDGIITDNL